MQQLHLNLKSIFQLAGMFISVLVFIIVLTVIHKKDYDTSYDFVSVGKDAILDEKRKVIQLEKDLTQAKAFYKYKMEHPTPVPQTPLRKYGYGGWTVVDENKPKNKFDMVIKTPTKPIVNQAVSTQTNIYNSPVQRDTQKMVRYEDWIDEVEVLQNPKPEDSIIKIESPKPGE